MVDMQKFLAAGQDFTIQVAANMSLQGVAFVVSEGHLDHYFPNRPATTESHKG